jgi:hypothetical protein
MTKTNRKSGSPMTGLQARLILEGLGIKGLILGLIALIRKSVLDQEDGPR